MDEDLVHEFILITGRSLQNDQLYEKVMTSLKRRQELMGLFERLVAYFRTMTQYEKYVSKWIIQDLEKRRSELALVEIRVGGGVG